MASVVSVLPKHRWNLGEIAILTRCTRVKLQMHHKTAQLVEEHGSVLLEKCFRRSVLKTSSAILEESAIQRFKKQRPKISDLTAFGSKIAKSI